MINASTGNIVSKHLTHAKKITQVYIKEYVAIISISFDGLLKITSLCSEFDDIEIDIEEYELSCFSLRHAFNSGKLEFFIGTGHGKLVYFYNGFFQNTKEVIHSDDKEGPITTVVCKDEVVTWATPKNIRVIHYSEKQKICLIERPKQYPTFPNYLYSSNAVKPTLLWRYDEFTKIKYFYVAWFNLIKLCKFK